MGKDKIKYIYKYLRILLKLIGAVTSTSFIILLLSFILSSAHSKNIEKLKPKTELKHTITIDTIHIKDYNPISMEKFSKDINYRENIIFLRELQENTNRDDISRGYCFVLSVGGISTMAEFITDSTLIITRENR